MGKPGAVKSEGIGIIPASNPFESKEWKKAIAKAKAHDPLKRSSYTPGKKVHLPNPSNPDNARFFAHVSPYSKKASHGKATATTGVGTKPAVSKPTPGVSAIFTRNGGIEYRREFRFPAQADELRKAIASKEIKPYDHVGINYVGSDGKPRRWEGRAAQLTDNTVDFLEIISRPQPKPTAKVVKK